jgi:hypothetical protein
MVFLFAACGAAPPALPDGVGRGLVQCDKEPPAGATTWQRPEWRVGDQFVFLRGESVKGEFVVTAVTAEHYAMRIKNIEVRRTLDLGNLGEWSSRGDALHVLSPVDVRYSWPLWVGKRWSCEFVDRSAGGEVVPTRADYVVEDLDTVTVAAGTFPALRIVRTTRRLDAEDFLPRWQVTWYSPDAGTEVRQQNGDTLVELEHFERAAATGSASGK